MVHIFVIDYNIVFGRHVISDVMIDDQSKNSIEQCQIDLFVKFFKSTFHHDITFTIRGFPNILKNWEKKNSNHFFFRPIYFQLLE